MSDIIHPIAGVKLVIFDMDGTLRRCTVPNQPCPNRRGQQEVYPGWTELFQQYAEAGVPIYFASNQAGVSKGYMTEDQAWDVAMETLELLDVDSGPPLLGEEQVRLSFRGRGCPMHKPAPGMLFDIIECATHDMMMERPLLTEVLFVGDWVTDLEAAERAGIRFMWAWVFNPEVPVNEECLEKLAKMDGK